MWTVTDKYGNRHISWMGDFGIVDTVDTANEVINTSPINGTTTAKDNTLYVGDPYPYDVGPGYGGYGTDWVSVTPHQIQPIIERINALERKLDAILEALDIQWYEGKSD